MKTTFIKSNLLNKESANLLIEMALVLSLIGIVFFLVYGTFYSGSVDTMERDRGLLQSNDILGEIVGSD